ncbi:MAG: DoxX family protein [Acidobacteriota bacterium]|nr:DoxX family protein [Acidobacteriota bacterium]
MSKLSASDWLLRGGVALVFFLIGMEKLTGNTWVKLFEEIGFGQWFRYFTGIVQITGSVLLLIPWTARLGAGLIGCTMLGAIILHVFVLSTGPFTAVIPGILLVFVVAAGWKGRSGTEDPDTILSLR